MAGSVRYWTLAGEFVGAIQAVKSICAKEGVRGMFAGYGSFLLRDLPFDAIEFVTYDQLRRAYKVSLAGSREVSSAETAVMGEYAPRGTGGTLQMSMQTAEHPA